MVSKIETRNNRLQKKLNTMTIRRATMDSPKFLLDLARRHAKRRKVSIKLFNRMAGRVMSPEEIGDGVSYLKDHGKLLEEDGKLILTMVERSVSA